MYNIDFKRAECMLMTQSKMSGQGWDIIVNFLKMFLMAGQELEKRFPGIFEDLQDPVRKIPWLKMAGFEIHRPLIVRGWYPQPTFYGSDTAYLIELAQQDGTLLDGAMATFIEASKTFIQQDLTLLFPRRADQFRQVVSCHERGDYAASASTALMVFDGVVKGLTQFGPYSKHRPFGKASPAEPAINQLGTRDILLCGASAMAIGPLTKMSPLIANATTEPFNRMAIQHGEDTNITFEKSLRGISLLGFLRILASDTYKDLWKGKGELPQYKFDCTYWKHQRNSLTIPGKADWLGNKSNPMQREPFGG